MSEALHDVVDAHHHVWSLARGDYGWLTPHLGVLYRDYDLDDYGAVVPQPVSGSVLVQAAPTMAETRFLLDVAKRSGGRVQAVVGWVDLDADDAGAALRALAAEPLLRGVRPMLQDLDDAEWILRPRVDAALSAVAELGLAFDALVTPRELPAILRMLERHPRLRVVVDHGAKPGIAAGLREPWATDLRAVARHPNVHCKLSGLATEAMLDWRAATLRPYVEHLLDCFGTGRLMWGSDWPVVERGGGMERWWDATRALLAPLDRAAQAAILAGNARRFYRFGR